MTQALTEPVEYPPRWYLGFVMVMGGVAVLALAVGLIGLYANDANARKQAACFDQFAAQFSTVSKEVRAAQVHSDDVESEADKAAADRDAAFQGVLTFILAQEDDKTEGLRLFTKLTDANAVLVEKRRALVVARAELQQTRKEHPIPEAPEPGSASCDL